MSQRLATQDQLAATIWPLGHGTDRDEREPHLIADDALPSPIPLSLQGRAPLSVWTREGQQRRLLASADVIASVVSIVALGLASPHHASTGIVALVAVVAAVIAVVAFKLAGLYDRVGLCIGHSTLDEVPDLFKLSAVLGVVAALLLSAVGSRAVSADRIGLLVVVLFVTIAIGRGAARAIGGSRQGVERCLVVGDLAKSERIREKLAQGRARAEIACLPVSEGTTDVLADPDIIPALVNELQVHRIIIAPDHADGPAFRELIRVARAVSVRVSVMQAMSEVVGTATRFEEVEGLAMLGVARFGLSRSSRRLKRGLDIAGALGVLVLLAPLLIAIAIAIRLDSRGPALFRQVRVGRAGRHFRIVKFRSMVSDAESRKEEFRHMSIAGEGLFKVRDDPRITRLGRFLRSSSLDELPQLLNVLRGEMSLVGPRPLVTDEDDQVQGLDRCRLRLTPGITGPWQLLNDRVALREMTDIDYLYATNWSVWLDLKILLRTVAHILRRGNV